mgnify:CR=1 FL=1
MVGLIYIFFEGSCLLGLYLLKKVKGVTYKPISAESLSSDQRRILQKVLENSGLTEGVEFTTQQGFKDEEQKSRITDVIVKLPEDRHLIIDSKVSLVQYEQWCNRTEHARSVRWCRCW